MEVLHEVAMSASSTPLSTAASRSSYSSRLLHNLQQLQYPTRRWYKHDLVYSNSCSILRTSQDHISRKRHGQYSVRATVDSSCPTLLESPPNMSTISNAASQHTFLERVEVFYRFTRPYAIIATVLGVTSVSLLALQSYQEISLRFVLEVVGVLIPTILMNIYIVGINQVIDVDIDKVNKPSLPLASGEFSLNTGISLTIFSATLSFALGGFVASTYLTRALILGFVLGTVYSLELPLMRWKKWGVTTVIAILLYRTIVVQLCTFLHMQTFFLKKAAILNKPMIFLSAFTCIISSILAVIKDIPDLEGDKAHGMQSFVVQLGPDRVYWFCMFVLMATYGVAILVGLTSKVLWAQVCTIAGHGIAASVLWHHAVKVNPKDNPSVSRTYMLVWNLFYAEFFLAHFVR